MHWRIALVASVAACSGCATELAWPPAVQRAPEGSLPPVAVPATRPPPVALTHEEIVALARSGSPPGLIIQKMRDTRAAYSASPEQAASLLSQGVPPEVLSYMQYGEAGIAPRPLPGYYAYPYAPYSYYDYAPYPFGATYLGLSYGRWGRSRLHFGFGRRW